ncbi:unnamed protein product [Colias eurytheme]|nr:unnamed protein product [Colias eurytheme]
MHYGNYLFLTLLCIFQPIISNGNIVDGRESRSDRSLRFELSDRQSYRDVRERFSVSSPNKLSPEHFLIRDDHRGRSSLRNLERVDTILQRHTRTIRHLKTNEIRSQRLSRYQDRIIPDVRSTNDRTFDDASRNVRFERGTALLDTRKIASSTERVDVNENKLSRSRGISKNARSRSVNDLRQSERRISQNRFSPERNTHISRDESERSHNVERRLSSNAYHRRQETRQRTNVLPNRSRSLGREQIREMRNRNDDNLVRRERRISIENRRNVDKHVAISEDLRDINSQKRERFSVTLNRDVAGDRFERTVRGHYTRSRSLTRSNLRNSVTENMRERNINIIRAKRELERLGGNRRRESRSLSTEIRDMERDFAGRQYARNSKALVREIQGISEMRKPSRTLSRLNIRDARSEDRERVSRSELRERSEILFRETERTASRHERRNNMLRNTDEYGSRFDVSRNLINSFKNEEKTGMMNWQILFYTLQGIYLCSILVKAMNKNDYYMKKTRSFGWFPLSTAMKID